MSDTNSGSVNPVLIAAKYAFSKAQRELPGLNWKPEDEAKFMAAFSEGVQYLAYLQAKPTQEINAILKKWSNG